MYRYGEMLDEMLWLRCWCCVECRPRGFQWRLQAGSNPVPNCRVPRERQKIGIRHDKVWAIVYSRWPIRPMSALLPYAPY